MLGIQAISSFLPTNRIDNLVQADEFSVDRDFVAKKIGATELPRFTVHQSVTSACVEAFRRLQEQTGLNSEEVDCIIVCTQNPDRGGLPHNSAMVHAELAVKEDCACFDIGLGCSGYVYGLSIIKSFMESNKLKKGILFTCDPYSRILDPEDKNTSLLFGDAATATLISDSPAYIEETSKFATRGAGGNALEKIDGKLTMNGRAVFNFALTDVPKQIKATLAAARIQSEEVDLYLLHQGSRFMLENVIKRAKIPAEKAPVSMAATGNTVSSSIPLLLEQYLPDKPNRILMSGFGVGLSWATTIYTHC